MKNFQIFSIISLSLVSMNAIAMRRRVPSEVAPKVFFPLFTTQTRHLLRGQEKNSLWMQANKDVKNFRAQFELPTLTPSEIEAINQQQETVFQKQLLRFPPAYLNDLQKQKKASIQQEIVRLLEKHGIDSHTVKIAFISSQAAKKFELMGSFGIVGSTLLIAEDALQYTLEQITAFIEHEIGHLISHDTAYAIKYYPLKENNPVLYDYHHHLIEQRADIHSGIQSKKNVELIKDLAQGKGYDAVLKAHRITPKIQQLAPQIIENPEVINMLDPYLDPLAFEKIKTVAIQEYKARTINATVLKEIIALCDQPTYMNDLLLFHAEQERMNQNAELQ